MTDCFYVFQTQIPIIRLNNANVIHVSYAKLGKEISSFVHASQEIRLLFQGRVP